MSYTAQCLFLEEETRMWLRSITFSMLLCGLVCGSSQAQNGRLREPDVPYVPTPENAVSYTHLTLPTILRV